MSVLFFMIGISLLMALGFLGAFVWSMRTGQQDDLYTPSMRMLLDDAPPDQPAASGTKSPLPAASLTPSPTCRITSKITVTAV
ncbi:cbb3-type cytochrome oxidase maturation protein [Spirosoma lacussanchae]|uniref:cbb3-type cytochrome oxidase assembly protein CcoS n=1 Tax=Spirosoma lacussanchae TaxID=1884249 RepID=UPI001108EC1A|nr:cbb3-type cytochrome oxidase assembly protein CcoS [Spirosoma lacussanchae]